MKKNRRGLVRSPSPAMTARYASAPPMDAGPRPTRGKRTSMKRIAALLFVVLAGCQEGIWQGPCGAPAVVVMGDSLVFHADGVTRKKPQRVLADRLVTEGYRSYVTGYIGTTIPHTYAALWPKVPNPP